MGALWSSCTMRVRPLSRTNFWKGMSMSGLCAKMPLPIRIRTTIIKATLCFIAAPSPKKSARHCGMECVLVEEWPERSTTTAKDARKQQRCHWPEKGKRQQVCRNPNCTSAKDKAGLFLRGSGAKIHVEDSHGRPLSDCRAGFYVAAHCGNGEIPQFSGDGAGTRRFGGGDGDRGGAARESYGQVEGIPARLHR